MKNYPGLERRGSVYYYRVIIPRQLRSQYPGTTKPDKPGKSVKSRKCAKSSAAEEPRRELRISLNTTKKSEAISLWHIRSLAMRKEFQEKRKALAEQRESTRVKTVTNLNSQDTKGLLSLWTQSVLQTDDQLRMEGLVDEGYESLGERLSSTEAELRQSLARGRVEVIMPALKGFLELSEIELQATPEHWRELGYAFLQTVVRTLEYQRRRHAGEIVDTEAVAPAASAYRVGTTPANELDFDAIFELWNVAKKGRPSRTLTAYRQAWKGFVAFITTVGVKDVRAITRSHVVAFVEHLEKSPDAHYRTVEKKVGIVCSILGRAALKEKIPFNPATRIEVTKPARIKKPRLPFEVAELVRFFGHKLFQRLLKLPASAGGPAAWWLPILAYFTGAREEEIAQLTVRDVREAKGLGWYLEITDIGDGQTLKTLTSKRRMPIHAELIRAGFLHYVESLRKAEQVQLFPLLLPNKEGKRSARWGQWFGRYLRNEIGIKERSKVFHSFRHFFADLCRESGVDSEVARALTGHTQRVGNRDAASGYGGELYPLKPLFAAIEKLEFPAEIHIPVMFSKPR